MVFEYFFEFLFFCRIKNGRISPDFSSGIVEKVEFSLILCKKAAFTPQNVIH